MRTKPLQYLIVSFLLAFLLSLAFPIPASAAGTATVSGVVRDAFTGVPISGATVACSSGCSGSATTNDSGAYSLGISWGGLLPASSVAIQASAAGHSSSTSSFTALRNQSYTRDFSLNPSDSTPPNITYSITSGTLGNNGWYTSDVTVAFTVTDGESAITSRSADCNGRTISSNTSGTTITCTARSGGGESSSSVTIKLDKTAPVVTLLPDRLPNIALWYNAPVTYDVSGTDAFSGVASCTPESVTYSGPDTRTATVSGYCTDNAGNRSADTSFTFKYDATGPEVSFTPARSPDANGWYTAPITVSISGTDATSGMALVLPCTPVLDSQRTYSGPDNASASISGSCRDIAGNTTNVSFSLKYDTSAPTSVTLTPTGTMGNDNWYISDVTITTTGSDNVSPVTCTAAQVLSTDTAGQSFSGSCTNGAGMTTSASSITVKRDATAPDVTASPDRAANSHGWYTAPLTVSFLGTDALSGGVTCDTAKTYSGPDAASTSLSGNCTDAAGNTGTDEYSFQYDATAPTGISVSASRGPDAAGYYTSPFTATWSGSDTPSGIDSCTQINYSGPDNNAGNLSGSCTDNAGNVSGTVDFAFKYDATAPANVIAVADRAPDGNGYFNHPFTVTWSSNDSTASCTQTTYHGPDTDSGSGSLSGSCTDPAGNTSASVDFSFQYDSTAPVVTATASPVANANGWNNSSVTVTFTGTDTGSGIDYCDTPVVLNTNGSAQSASGTCTDEAGNVGMAGVNNIDIDLDRPTITLLNRTPAPNFWGWNSTAVTVKWACDDVLSGVVSNDVSDTVDTEGILQVAEGTCYDRAGNSSNDKVGNINILFPEHYIIPDTGDGGDETAMLPPTGNNEQQPQATQIATPAPTEEPGVIPETGGEENTELPQETGNNGLWFYVLGGLAVAGLLTWFFIFFLAKRRKQN